MSSQLDVKMLRGRGVPERYLRQDSKTVDLLRAARRYGDVKWPYAMQELHGEFSNLIEMLLRLDRPGVSDRIATELGVRLRELTFYLTEFFNKEPSTLDGGWLDTVMSFMGWSKGQKLRERDEQRKEAIAQNANSNN